MWLLERWELHRESIYQPFNEAGQLEKLTRQIQQHSGELGRWHNSSSRSMPGTLYGVLHVVVISLVIIPTGGRPTCTCTVGPAQHAGGHFYLKLMPSFSILPESRTRRMGSYYYRYYDPGL
jgi:hypothetical protein